MLCNQRIAILVFATLISVTKSSPASKFLANFEAQNPRLVARSTKSHSHHHECDRPSELTPSYWRQMKLDDYLRNYPEGNSLSLPMYVDQLHFGTEFDCGIHKHCSVGPICEPVRGNDYYVLFATAQWNYYTNSLSRVLTLATSLVKEVVPKLIHDFVELSPGESDAHTIPEPDLIRIMLGSISVGGTVNKSGVNNSTHPDYLAALEPLSTEVAQSMLVAAAHTSAGASPPKPHPETSNLLDTPSTSTNFTSHTNQTLNVGPSRSLPVEADPKSTQEQAQEGTSQDLDSEDVPSNHTGVFHNVQMNAYGKDQDVDAAKPAVRMQKRQLAESNIPVLPIVYNSTDTVENNIQALSTQFQAFVDDSFNHKINAPISEEDGIYGALKDGRFLVEYVEPASLRSNAEDVVNLLTISAILQAQSDCHMSDNHDSTLSFCSPDGTLTEIVRVEGNSIRRDIFNAELIENKYGFSTQFLAEEARRCQLLNDGKPDPPNFKHDQFDICTFDVQVCDLKEPRLAQMLQEGASIVKLCRQEVGLAI
ncbi:uncharacterized protein MELLADRAFT_106700 [Melampsora larici-populina 98AG31]|uniref:DUF7872 domain-containing protein n=1 Tax=Melampsora larici-populina (strain 98AG31 / pathotype 3-4-7) TaxID=747676 RepID=F4RMC6_MELLP|nr:uncharacterized protein MELLADRAFT_106700 [Melampsora larici-populina 98AG31]EGG06404.1 hypothetical protein MELLADRAFT_106700 [Melampsora larici-populina 98AG31]